MRRVVLRGLLTRKLRTVLTSLAILLGVAMIAGTFILTDQINNAFGDIFHTANAHTDAVLTRKAAFSTQQGDNAPLPESLVAKVRTVPGVAKAQGEIGGTAELLVRGKVIKSTGGAPSLLFSHADPPFNPDRITQGRFPQRSGEIAIIEQSAKDHDITVPSKAQINTHDGLVPVTIVGIFKFGDVASIGGATVIEAPFRDVQTWLQRPGEVDSIAVDAAPGITPEEIVQRIKTVVPSYVKVQTGEENADDQTKQIADQINGFLGTALLAFAGVAVLVGAFIIFNTFSITVAQRSRELALLRTLGATRRQVLGSVLGEALVVGFGASLVGLLGGFLIDKALVSLFDAIGFGLPLAGLPLKPRTVIVAMGVGIVITLLASLAPALRATRVPPIAALQEGAVLPPGRFARFTPYVAALLGIGGLALIANGVFGSGDASSRLLGMGLGAVLVFIAVAMLAKYVVVPISRLVGYPLRLFGITGRLAGENARRNPSRTAVTASALMIGIGLAVFVAVFAAGLKDSFTGGLDRSIKSDLVVRAADQQGGGNLSIASQAQAKRVSGVQVASPIKTTQVRFTGAHGNDSIYGVDPETILDVYRFDWQDGGTDAAVQQLGTTGALLEQQTADSHHLKVGSQFSVLSPQNKSATYTVRGIYKDQVVLNAGFIVSTAAYDKVAADRTPAFVLITTDPGSSVKTVQSAVEQALGPVATVQTTQEFKDDVVGQLNQLVAVLSVLLAMSVIISIFGIVNTLVLTIYERTREIGMLRAIGTSRWQVRWTIFHESVITAVIGGILGLAVGLVFGYVITKGLSDQGLSFVIPVGQLVVFVIVAVIVGMLAAIFPARRAAKLNVLEALHYE